MHTMKRLRKHAGMGWGVEILFPQHHKHARHSCICMIRLGYVALSDSLYQHYNTRYCGLNNHTNKQLIYM